MNRNLVFVLIGVLFLLSCKDEGNTIVNSDGVSITLENASAEITMNEFVKWIADEENSLSKVKKISELEYHLSYMPKECLAYLELRNIAYSDKEFDSVQDHYSDMSYFNLKIQLESGQGELLKYKLRSAQEYEQRLNYISFDMQKDVMIIQNNDTLFPGIYHYERIFEVAPYATVMVAFDNKKFDSKKEFTVVFNDRLFNKGLIKYTYKDYQLIDLPNITGV